MQSIDIPGSKRRWVVGLHWRHEDRRPSRGAMAKLSREYGRWGLVRRTSLGTTQSAFGQPITDRRAPRGLISLAAVIADLRPEPWLAIFDLGNGLFWHIAVRDNQEIMPDGDFIGDAYAAGEMRSKHESLGDWTVHDGDLHSLGDLLDEVKPAVLKGSAIVDLQHKPWIMPTLGALTLGAAAVSGLALWERHEQAVRLRQEMAAARKAAIERAMQAKANAAPVLPWSHEASCEDVLGAARQAWNAQPLAISGWALSAWALNAQGASTEIQTQWTSAGGSPLSAPGLLDADAKKSSEQQVGPRLTLASSSLVLHQQEAMRTVWDLRSRYGLEVQVQPAPRPLVAPGAKAPPAPAWSISQVRVWSDAPLWALGLDHAMAAIPGLRLRLVRFEGGHWLAEGVLYAIPQ